MIEESTAYLSGRLAGPEYLPVTTQNYSFLQCPSSANAGERSSSTHLHYTRKNAPRTSYLFSTGQFADFSHDYSVYTGRSYACVFNSLHPGGANFTFGDGSGRFLSETIDWRTYAKLGYIHDGIPVKRP